MPCHRVDPAPGTVRFPTPTEYRAMPTTDKNRNGRHSHPQNTGSKAQGDPGKDGALDSGDKGAKGNKEAAPKKAGSGKDDESE
jgi:hypothetical protein